MAYNFWSDKEIVLSIDNKSIHNTGIGSVEIKGDDTNIICSNVKIDDTLGNSTIITGNNIINGLPKSTLISSVRFFASVKDPSKQQSTGTISVKIKWFGPDGILNTEDDGTTDYYNIPDVTIKNAIDSIVFNNESYEADYGDTLNISFESRGEKHGDIYLPVYLNEVIASLTKNGTEINNKTITNTGKTGTYTLSCDNEGEYVLTLTSNASELTVTASANIKITIPELQLDYKKLDYSKLG